MIQLIGHPLPGDMAGLVAAINARLRQISTDLDRSDATVATLTTSAAAAGELLQGTHATRLASYDPDAQPLGTLYWETDRTVLYQVNEITAGGRRQWQYRGGTFAAVLASKPTDLAGTAGAPSDDTGFLLHVTDYNHVLRWTGSAWQWGPGETGSGYVQMFAVAPTGNGWKLVDGNGDDGSAIGVAHPIAYLKSDGTTSNLTAFAALSGHFPKFGAAFTGAAVAAVAPGVTGSTASESSHTHAIDHDHASASTSTDGSHDHSMAHDHSSATSGSPSSTTSVQSGSGATVASSSHTHDTDLANFAGNTGSGGSHSHTVDLAGITQASGSGSAHSHGVGTLAADATGEPANMVFLPYFRK